MEAVVAAATVTCLRSQKSFGALVEAVVAAATVLLTQGVLCVLTP